jgi:hypothetical protein
MGSQLWRINKRWQGNRHRFQNRMLKGSIRVRVRVGNDSDRVLSLVHVLHTNLDASPIKQLLAQGAT